MITVHEADVTLANATRLLSTNDLTNVIQYISKMLPVVAESSKPRKLHANGYIVMFILEVS